MKTAYLTYSHPALSQTFIVDEVRWLREMGVEVETWGIRPAADVARRTDRYQEETARTRVLRPVAWAATVRAHRRAMTRAPVGYLRGALQSLSDRPPGLRALGLSLAAFVVGVRMWNELEGRGIRHVHAHFAGSPAHVAAFVAAFGNRMSRGGEAWTWSLSVHGPDDFADITALRLRERVSEALFVIAISDFARAQLLMLLPLEEWAKVHVVRCGIDIPSIATAKGSVDRGELRVLCVGRLVPPKGQAVLLEALAGLISRAIPTHVTLVGEGSERARLEHYAERLGVGGHVTFTGALGHQQVLEEYARSDVFCLPSFAEGVPVVLMEAMAAGLPVVSTRIAGVSELVEDGMEGILVRPGRADLLEEALTSLAADPARRCAWGRSGRAKVARDYDIRRNAAQLAEVHREARSAGRHDGAV